MSGKNYRRLTFSDLQEMGAPYTRMGPRDLCRKGLFPAPVMQGPRSVRWFESEVRAWLGSLPVFNLHPMAVRAASHAPADMPIPAPPVRQEAHPSRRTGIAANPVQVPHSGVRCRLPASLSVGGRDHEHP
jgi:CP4-57 regulatory protein AlpA